MMKKLLWSLLLVALALHGVAYGEERDDFKFGQSYEKLLNMFRDINILFVDPVDPDEILENAAEGMVKNLDPYTEYISEEDMAEFEIATTGKYGGIGSMIRKKGEWVLFAQPYKGYPADKAGLQIGDKILEINGKSAKGYDLSTVSSLLKGDPGTKIKIKVEKFHSGEIVNITLKRERIAISGIQYYGFVADSVGYIQHSDFTENCADDMRKAIMEMKNSGKLGYLILDLRSNGGGILQEAVKILSMFLPQGTEVVSMRGRRSQLDATFKTEQDPIIPNIPMVVLVNGNSASAAEIVSGAIQDLDRGVLMGQRTFGKGLVQSTRPLGYNAFLKITTAKYYIPSGRCIQAIDYSHHKADGSVGAVPDSLIKEFKTAAGRKVFDGGGVVPEITTKPEYSSRFAMILYAKNYIDDFVDIFCKAHPEKVSPTEFMLSEKDYDDFVAFMQGKDVGFESETKKALEKLRKKAERELYLDQINDQLTLISKNLTDDLNSNLQLHKEEIKGLLEDAVVLRSNYKQGVIERHINKNKDIKQAIELLKNHSEYNAKLTAQ